MSEIDRQAQSELDALASQLRRAVREAAPPDIDLRRLDVEWRARHRATQRRSAAALVVLVAGVATVTLGLRLAGDRGRATAGTQLVASDEPGALSMNNRTAMAQLVDLGDGVGRMLVEPGARLAYRPAARTVALERGALLLHVLKGGAGFTVQAGAERVEVLGTVFRVSDTSPSVRVWRGAVRRTRHEPNAAPVTDVIVGDETFRDISSDALARLGVDVPALPPAASSVRPAEPRAAPAQAPPAVVVDDDNPPLGVEREVLLRAQALLAAGAGAGDAAAAAELLREHERQHPSSLFAEEVGLLLLRALVRQEDHASVRAEAERFLKRFPQSTRRTEVERLLQDAARGR